MALQPSMQWLLPTFASCAYDDVHKHPRLSFAPSPEENFFNGMAMGVGSPRGSSSSLRGITPGDIVTAKTRPINRRMEDSTGHGK